VCDVRTLEALTSWWDGSLQHGNERSEGLRRKSPGRRMTQQHERLSLVGGHFCGGEGDWATPQAKLFEKATTTTRFNILHQEEMLFRII
jgi:hypothetical protein